MKKKVLFALIALFSFVSAWAQTGDKVGTLNGYDVYLSQKLVAVSSGTPTAPTVSVYNGATKVTAGVTVDDGVYIWDATTNGYTLYEGDLTFGNYYKKVSVISGTSRKSAYVPFQVGTLSTKYDFIHDEASWNNSFNATNGALGGLQDYYNANPDEDRWNSEAQRWAQAGDKVSGEWPAYCQHSWKGAQAAPNALYPWIVPYLVEVEGSYKLAFSYPGYPVCYPWGATTFGNGQGDRVRGCASIPEELGVAAGMDARAASTMTEDQLSAYPFAQRPVWEDNEITGYSYPNGTFEIAKFKMILTPATDPQAMSPENDPKNIADDDVIKSIPAKIIYGSTINSEVALTYNGVPLVAGTDYTIATVDKDQTTYSPNIGTKTITITGAGAYTGTVSQDFEVAQYNLTISAAQVYKTYGEDDPTKPDFTVDYNSDQTELTAEQKAHILSFLEFQRYSNEGNSEANKENAGDHDYIIVKKANMDAECNYKVTVQNNTSILYIRKAPLTIDVNVNKLDENVEDTWKIFNEADPTVAYNGGQSLQFTLPNAAAQLKNGDTKETAVKVLGREEGEDAGFYQYKADAPNYEVTFVGGYGENKDQFQIKKAKSFNGSISISPVTYDGTEKQPKPTVTYTDLKGVTKTLTENTDYTLSYEQNVHVAQTSASYQPKCVVTFIKNFDCTKKQDFTIKPKALTIKGGNIEKATGDAVPTVEELKAALVYDGLAEADQTVISGKVTLTEKNSVPGKRKAPTTTIKSTTYQGVYDLVVNNDYTMQDYDVTLKNGLLTFGIKQLFVYPDDKEVTYGADPAPLTATLYWADKVALTETELASMSNVIMHDGKYFYTLSSEGADKTQDAGDYVIESSGPKALSGYAVNYETGTYTIKKATLTITPKDQTKVYGEEDPELTVTVTGLLNGDKEEDVLTATYYTWGWGGQQANTDLIYTVSRQYAGTENTDERVGENVGKYPITVAFQSWYNADMTKNYTVVLNNYNNNQARANLTITKRPLTVKVENATKFYGETDPEWTITYGEVEGKEVSGLKVWTRRWWYNTWTQEDQIDSRAWGIIQRERPAGTRNGEDVREEGYKLHFDRKDCKWEGTRYIDYNPNYDITYVDGKLTINKCVINVTAKDQGIDYGKEINSAVILDAQGNKIYAFEIAVAEDDNDKPMGAMVNREVIVGYNGQTPITLNDLPEDILSLKKDITKVGYHNPADETVYTYIPTALGEKNYKINEFKDAWLSISALKVIPLDKNVTVYEGKTLPLYQVLDDHQGAKVGFKMPSNRAFEPNTWYTLVLPFDIQVRDLSQALGYAVVDIFDKNNNTADVKLKLHVGLIKANEPFIVKIDEVDEGITKAEMANINFGGKQFTVAKPEGGYAVKDAEGNIKPVDPVITDKAGNTFTGTYAGKKPMATDEYFIAENSGTFYQGSDDVAWSIKQTEAYLKKSSSTASGAPLRIFIEEPDGTTTAIEAVEAGSEAASAEFAEGWYTVTGVKLDAEPTTSGTYIFNGKKVFIQK